MIGSAAMPVAFVYVSDRERAAAFYRDALGLELLGSDPFGDLFAIGGGQLRLTPLPDVVPSEHPALGWQVTDLGATVDALAGKGIALIVYRGLGQDEQGIWTSPDGGTRMGWFADPDGNLLMLLQK